jgi:lipopolysaccharide heptosyltransferase III
MAKLLDNLPRDARIAVIRLRSLGDSVLTTPALQILKRCRPDLRIGVLVEERFRAVFEGNPDVEVLLPPRINALRAWRAGLVLNLHGGARSAVLTGLSGAALRAGFAHFRHSFAYNIRIPTAQEILHLDRKVHTAEHLASAVFHLGVPITEIPRARLVASPGRPVPAPYAVLHPFASHPDKTWPAEGFRTVAGSLDLEPVFIGAATDDFTPFRAWRCLAGAPLSEIKNLLAGASLFIGNDSGPAHMAAAFGIPVVALFGSSDPAIWGPWRTAAEILTPGQDLMAAIRRLRVHA